MGRLANSTALLMTLFAAGTTVAAAGCSVDSTTGPGSNCASNNTAQISFRNNSNTNSTYTVIWDGATLTTIAPGQTSQEFTVAAGVQHSLVFRHTNTNANACNPSTPTLSQCSSRIFSCTG